jgi:hypothetical protein
MCPETNEPDVSTMMDLLYSLPTDDTLFKALQDKLMDLGVSAEVALAVARKQRTEGGDQIAFIHALDWVGEKTRRGARLRATIRAAAGITSDTHRRIIVSRGCGAPIATGEAGYSTFPNGDRASAPAAAIKAGHRLAYHPSTLAIQVGATWIVGVVAADGTPTGQKLKWHTMGSLPAPGIVTVDRPDGGLTGVVTDSPEGLVMPKKGRAS